MSNPDTDAQAEDMLSSVRRLVSSDVRPDGGEGEDVEQTSTEAPAPGLDRLVLSPALRVAAVTDDVEAMTSAGHEDEPLLDEEIEAVSDDIEDKGMVFGIDDDETEPEPASLSGKIDPDALQFLFRARKRSESMTEAEAELDELEVAQSPELVATDAVEKLSPLLLTNPQLRADKSGHGAGDSEQDQLGGDDDAVAFPPSNQNDSVISPEELAAKIAAVEAVVAQASDHWDSEGDRANENAETAVEVLEWEDLHDLDISDEELEQTGQAAATADAPEEGAIDLQGDQDNLNPDSSDIDEDAVLDEEVLRELVNDIVQQELNGKLGERITHNVRKLVRRELQRALASQDLS